MTLFQEFSGAEWLEKVLAADSPFLTKVWEDELAKAFPYLSFRHFVYRDAWAVRLSDVSGRLTTAPFSDGGDIISLKKTPLSLKEFYGDCLNHFGSVFTVRVHEWFCPVNEAETALGDIIDFRVSLSDFDASCLRKTLRHIVLSSLPNGAEIRKAASEDDLKRAYHLYLRTMKEARALALPLEMFKDFLAHDIFLFLERGVVRGVSVFLGSGKTRYHFISATDERGKVLHAAHHLLFRALTHFRESGVEAVFLGGTRTDSKLRTFKEGWRGTPYTLYTVSTGSAHEAGRKSSLRVLWGLVPMSLLPKATKLAGKYFF